MRSAMGLVVSVVKCGLGPSPTADRPKVVVSVIMGAGSVRACRIREGLPEVIPRACSGAAALESTILFLSRQLALSPHLRPAGEQRNEATYVLRDPRRDGTVPLPQWAVILVNWWRQLTNTLPAYGF